MKKILLVCCAGMSTSLLVNRMREVAKTKEIDCKIWSTSEKELPNEFAQEPADVIHKSDIYLKRSKQYCSS